MLIRPKRVAPDCTCLNRALRQRASSRWPAMRTPAASSTRRAAVTRCAHQALAYYRQLYELERHAKDFSDEQRRQMRQDLAVPILGQFHTWLEAQRPEVLPKSPIG